MLVAVLMALMVSCAPSAGNETHIVILATSDLHGNVWGYTYEDNAESSNNGMARLYTYIKQVREENPVVFLIDGGDDIANKVSDSEHPVMAAMNFMGYDSMTLGNHEFNWGISTMKKILSQAKFPVLGANILDQDGNYITGQGWTIIERGGVRLAVNNYRYTSAIRAQNLAEGKRFWESSNSICDMIVNYFHDYSPVEPTVDNNWRITGVDLSKDDPRRAEIIGYINDGLLPTPLRKSYNLADYGELAAEAEANRP